MVGHQRFYRVVQIGIGEMSKSKPKRERQKCALCDAEFISDQGIEVLECVDKKNEFKAKYAHMNSEECMK